MIGQSFEKITTHSKNTIYIHTECAYGNEPVIYILNLNKSNTKQDFYTIRKERI